MSAGGERDRVYGWATCVYSHKQSRAQRASSASHVSSGFVDLCHAHVSSTSRGRRCEFTHIKSRAIRRRAADHLGSSSIGAGPLERCESIRG